jgi:hypothetical protein
LLATTSAAAALGISTSSGTQALSSLQLPPTPRVAEVPPTTALPEARTTTEPGGRPPPTDAGSPVPGLVGNASLGPTSVATRGAERLLFKLNQGNLRETVQPRPCAFVASGRVGPLEAPYRVCATSTAEGHFVTLVAVGRSPVEGISFTDRGPETFLDECYRHLEGHWYAFRAADLSNPAAPCHGPWRFHGGP